MKQSDGREGRRQFHSQSIFGTGFTFLTSGVFLSGFAIYLGASDLLLSYISMIANICGVSILLFASRMQRFTSYKRVAVGLTLLSRAATLLIVLVPVFVPANGRMAVFVPMIVLAFTLQAQTTVVINNWMVTFVEEKSSGRYVSRRQTLVLLVTVVLSFVGGRFVDAANGAYAGFVVLFSAALVMAAMETMVLARIPDARQAQTRQHGGKLRDSLRVPARCKPFLHFVIYIFAFYFLLSMADSFTVVYMMRYLKLPYTTTTMMQMLISLPQIFLLGLWGKISDRRGHGFALTASIWFFVGETFFLALSGPHNLYVCIPVAFLFAAVANSGFVVSVFNRRYELMPVKDRVLYDNFYSAAIGLAFILGPLVGGCIKQGLESVEWLSQALPLGSIRLLYALSTLGIVVLQGRVLHKRWKPCGKSA